MADPLTAGIVLGSVALAGAGAQAGYGIVQDLEAKDRARHAAEDTKKANDTLLAEQDAQKKAQLQDQQTQAMKTAALTQRGYSVGAQPTGGKSGTILTSPLGIPNASQVGGRTLLGG